MHVLVCPTALKKKNVVVFKMCYGDEGKRS